MKLANWTISTKPARSAALFDRAEALYATFEQSERPDDLDEAISLHRDALKLRPVSHPHRFMSLNNLALTLLTRFEESGRRDDLEEAIALHREAVALLHASYSHRSMSPRKLVNALRIRFRQSGRHDDQENELSSRPSHPDRPSSLNGLANALKTRFELSGRREDLEEAVSLHRDALKLLPASDPDRTMSLNNLASSLLARFELSGQRDDLEEAVSLHREALELRPATHPDRYRSLNNLGAALSMRFEQSGQRNDLEEAISLYKEGLELQPGSHPDRSMFLDNLATALSTQFELSGRRDDLDEAVSLHREALELRPESHSDRYLSLNNLAIALSTRYEQSGRREGLEEAVSLYREALKLRSASHRDKSGSLNNFASALLTRFKLSGQRDDLEEAVSLHRDALELQPLSHPDRLMSLNNLANTLRTRFDQLGRREDLDEAVSLHRDALELLLPSHPDRSTFLNNLASSLRTRFEQSSQRDDLEGAIKVSYQCLNALPCGHPSTSLYSRNQGNLFIVAYYHTQEPEYLHSAMCAFKVAVTCEAAPASLRFRAARDWAYHADSRHSSALDAYQAAIRLLPRLAMLGLDLPSRQQALTSGSDGLARDAAACAIRSGQYDKAVELLEEGRAVFWSQALQLRTPMADLRNVAPELEEKLRHISLALEQGSLRDVSRSMSDPPQKVMSIEQEASHFRHLNDEWLAVLEEVRRLERFQDFLCPTRLSTLLSAATKGPVVILNASKQACDALILTLTGVQHVPLVLTFADVAWLVKLIRTATAPGSQVPVSESVRGHIEGLLQQMPPLHNTLQLLRQDLERGAMTQVSWSNIIFQNVLAILWESAIKPVIHLLDLKRSDVPSSLWWCPTGPFAFLPIHAAGIYNTEEPECVSDYVVSSYTPTISALLNPIIPPHPNSFKMMVVTQPKSLPYTRKELEQIQAHVPINSLIGLESGTVKDVISHLPTTSVVHFACHGQQHIQNPLQSALILEDGPLTVSQIMQQSISNATLAFLSACQTAMGDENLPDEVIHLASTLLFAGFQGVVATMWSMSDEDGPKIADTFYEYLFRRNNITITDSFQPNITHAAQALQVAVGKLHSEGVSFARWVSFIHLGR